MGGGGGRGEAVSKRRRRRRKKATGTHVSKKGFLGFLQEEGEGARGWSAWGQRASGRGRGEGGERAALPRSCAQHFNRFHLRACE